jgi:serine/threonine-protein kinase
MILGTVAPAEAGPKAMAAIMRALELDSTRAEVHSTLALMKGVGMWDWKAAEEEFKKAINLNPNFSDAHAFYSHFLNFLGRTEEAMQQIELALDLDPNNPMTRAMYGVDLIFARRDNEAVTAFQEALKSDSTNPVALCMMPVALHLAGRDGEILEIWRKYLTNTYTQVAHAFDVGFARSGYKGALLAEADTLAFQSKTSYVNPTDIAMVYAVLGNKERTLDMLEQGFMVHDPNMPYLLQPLFENLHSDPRFKELCRKMGLPLK